MEDQAVSATSALSARGLIAKLEEMRDGGYSPDWMHIIATVSNYLSTPAARPGIEGIDLATERALFIARQRQKDSIPDFIDDATIMKGEITQHEWAGWQDRAAIAAGEAAPAENRRIPDSECAQGSCMRMTTGCLGKCALAKHNLPITTTAASIP